MTIARGDSTNRHHANRRTLEGVRERQLRQWDLYEYPEARELFLSSDDLHGSFFTGR
jgi:hypothetical protein